MANLLITGGAGYIGSHTCLALLQMGHSLVVIDDFSNGSVDAIRAVARLAGLQQRSRSASGQARHHQWHWQQGGQHLTLLEGDIRLAADLQLAFEDQAIDAVLHFAGLKAVAESVAKPLDYWNVNVAGSRQVLEVMADLRRRAVDIVTIGQYLSPGPKHLPVDRFVTPDQFTAFQRHGEQELGFLQVVSTPLTRSSYHAGEVQRLMREHPR